MSKRGYVWVSAVLYIALGVIAISIVLSATLPLIEKMKDKNTFSETKEVLYVLDKNIREVFNEGPGSQRILSPFIIREGMFYIDENDYDTINWSYKTKAFILEPGASKTEGNIYISSIETNITDESLLELSSIYTFININITSSFGNPFLGTYTIVVKNTGVIKDGKTIVNLIVN
jgi:type II secretory pathway pseudopilin PulG